MNGIRNWWFKKRQKKSQTQQQQHPNQQWQTAREDVTSLPPLPPPPSGLQPTTCQEQQQHQQHHQQQQNDDLFTTKEITRDQLQQHYVDYSTQIDSNDNFDNRYCDHDVSSSSSSSSPDSCRWRYICCRRCCCLHHWCDWFTSSSSPSSFPTRSTPKQNLLSITTTNMEDLADTAPGTPFSATGSTVSQQQRQEDQNQIIMTEETPLLVPPLLNIDVKYYNIQHNQYKNNRYNSRHPTGDNIYTVDDERNGDESIDKDNNNNNNNTSAALMMIILVLDVSIRRFELVAVPYTRRMTVGHVLHDLLPDAIQEEQLQSLTFTGLMSFDLLNENHGNKMAKSSELSRPQRYYTSARQRLPSLPQTTNAPSSLLWVATTSHLSVSQVQYQTGRLLQNPAVQMTLKTNGVDVSRWEGTQAHETHGPPLSYHS